MGIRLDDVQTCVMRISFRNCRTLFYGLSDNKPYSFCA